MPGQAVFENRAMSNQPWLSNDTAGELRPVTDWTGATLEYDFPEVRVGIGEYLQGPTGCTVFAFPNRSAVSIDVRGGSPGYLGSLPIVDAVCLTGGSIYGLEAAAGVQAELLAMREYRAEWQRIAIVDAAVIFDYGPRGNSIYPDKALGRAAMRSARSGRFPLGARGAGMSATVGKGIAGLDREAAGQGAAFRQVGDINIAVFTVVNAVGNIVDRDGSVVRGCLDPESGLRIPYAEAVERQLEQGEPAVASPGNTTLTVVVTNQILTEPELRQVGRQVHSSMARAIQPFHAFSDGDVLFALSTNQVTGSNLTATTLATLASELAWDAVLCSFDRAVRSH